MKKYLAPFCLLGIMLCASETSFSQQSPKDSIWRVVKEDLEVSSTRVSESKLDVPMGITTVSEAQFTNSRGYELNDALSLVPGVFSQGRSGHTDARITIRGYGARGAGDRSNAGNLRGIRVMIDGVPETEPDGRTSLDNVDLSSYSHIEVLRSNASSLYGSAAGGVISLYTNLDFPNSFVDESFKTGSFGFMKNSVSAGALSGSSHIYAGFSNASYEGFRPHSESQTGNAKIVITSKLGENTDLLINASAASNIFRFPGPLTFAQFEANPLQADSTYVARDEHRFNRVGKFSLEVDHDLGGGSAISGTVFLQPKILTRSERGQWREFNRYSIGSSGAYSWLAELNPTTHNTLLLGFDQQFQDGTIQFFNMNSSLGRGTILRQDKSEASSNVGLYLQDQFAIDDLTLVLGGRYDLLRYQYEDFTGAIPKDDVEFTAFTPKAAVSYKLGSQNSVYVAYGGGLEAPAFNEIDPPDSAIIASHGGTFNPNASFSPFLKPAKSTSIELGTKGIITGGGSLTAISYDVALFSIKVTDDIIPWNGGAFYFMAGKTSRTGGELGLAAYFDFGLTARTAFTFMSAKYDEYSSDLGTFDGNKQAGIPDIFGRFSLHYDTEFGLFAEAGLNHVGEYYADDRNDKLPDGTPDSKTNSLAPAYTIFDLTLGYQRTLFEVLNLNLFVGISNLTDQSYISSVFINGTGNRYFEPGMPRNFVGGVSLKYNFSK
ncbi:MAG: TonB-dependent receptor [Ignavibacteriota bacterium]